MNKEQLAKELAEEIIIKPYLDRYSLEIVILKKLTEVLCNDKGRLTSGTITK